MEEGGGQSGKLNGNKFPGQAGGEAQCKTHWKTQRGCKVGGAVGNMLGDKVGHNVGDKVGDAVENRAVNKARDKVEDKAGGYAGRHRGGQSSKLPGTLRTYAEGRRSGDAPQLLEIETQRLSAVGSKGGRLRAGHLYRHTTRHMKGDK